MDCPCSPNYVPLVTEAALQALILSAGKGMRRVKYADKEVEYGSIRDMLALIQWMKNELNPCMSTGKVRFETTAYDAGLGHGHNGFETEENFRTW